MRPRSIVLLVITLLLVIFAGLNWQNLLATTPIDFLLVEVEAPLGILMLLVVALMTLLFLGFVGFLEAQARWERKRLNDEIDRWRDLADKAEGSRIQELREIIEAGFDDIYDRIQRPAGASVVEPEPPEQIDEPEDAGESGEAQDENGEDQ